MFHKVLYKDVDSIKERLSAIEQDVESLIEAFDNVCDDLAELHRLTKADDSIY